MLGLPQLQVHLPDKTVRSPRAEVKLIVQNHMANTHKIEIPKDQKSPVTLLVPVEPAL